MTSNVSFAWTDATVTELRRLAAAGQSAGQISLVLGCSRNAVIGKCVRSKPRIRLAGGADPDKKSSRANTLAGRLTSGKTTLAPRASKAAPKPPAPPPVANLLAMRPAPPELAAAKAESYLSSTARRHAFDPAHAPAGARLLPLVDLERGMCKWPLYEDGPAVFCGCTVTSVDQNGQPGRYCETHAAMSRSPTGDRR